MYKELIATNSVDLLFREKDSIYSVTSYSCDIAFRPISVDVDFGDRCFLKDSENVKAIDLHEHLWIVEEGEDYESELCKTKKPASLNPRTISIYSFDGKHKYSLPEIKGELHALSANEDWVYLVNEHVYGYNTDTHECHDLGIFPLEGNFSYQGTYRGLHFFIQESSLIALRGSKEGKGLEEAYRIDLSKHDQLATKDLSHPLHILTFYQSEVWISASNQLYQIHTDTGELLSTLKDISIPEEMLLEGALGYSISSGIYRVFDFKKHRLLSEKQLGLFTTYEGQEYSAEYTLKLVHEGFLYTSVYVPDLSEHYLAVFDTQKEEFCWYGITTYRAPIDSAYILGDRLISCDGVRAHFYQRTAPTAPGMDEYIKIKKIQNVLDIDPATGNYIYMKGGSEFYLSLNGVQINIDFKPYSIVQGTWPEFITTIGNYIGVWWKRSSKENGRKNKLQIYSSEGELLNEFKEVYSLGPQSTYIGRRDQEGHNLISPIDGTELLTKRVPYRLYEENGLIFGYSETKIHRLDHTGDVIWTCSLDAVASKKREIIGIAHGMLWIQLADIIGINIETGEITHQLSDCYVHVANEYSELYQEYACYLRDTDKAIIAISCFGVKIFDTATAECIESYSFQNVDPQGMGRFSLCSLPILQGNSLTFVGTPMEERRLYLSMNGWAGIFDLKARKMVWADSVIPWQEKKETTRRLDPKMSRLYISGDKLYIIDFDYILYIYQRK